MSNKNKYYRKPDIYHDEDGTVYTKEELDMLAYKVREVQRNTERNIIQDTKKIQIYARQSKMF